MPLKMVSLIGRAQGRALSERSGGMETPAEGDAIEVIAVRFDVAGGGRWRPDAMVTARGVSRLFWASPPNGAALERSYGRLLARRLRPDGQRELTFQDARSHVVTRLIYDGPPPTLAD